MVICEIKRYIKNNSFFLKKMLVFSLVSLPLFFVFFSYLSTRYGIWLDLYDGRCIPEYSVFLVKKNIDIDKIEKGQIVTFKTHEKIKEFEVGTSFGKYVYAISGDKIDINKNGVFINDSLIVKGFPLANVLDANVDSFYSKFTLKDNEYFVLGTSDRSYDSRYWGVITREQITGVAVPWW